METKQYVKKYIIDHGLVAKAAKIDASDPDVRPDLAYDGVQVSHDRR